MPRPAQPFWSLPRASGIGILAGLAAILLAAWPGSNDVLTKIYAALLAVTAFCGASVLWITASDMRRRGTSGRMRAIRGFDISIGIVLLIPATWYLKEIWPRLGW